MVQERCRRAVGGLAYPEGLGCGAEDSAEGPIWICRPEVIPSEVAGKEAYDQNPQWEERPAQLRPWQISGREFSP